MTKKYVIITYFVSWEHKETNTGKWSDMSLSMIPFLSFHELSKKKLVTTLSIKETVLDITLVYFVVKGMQPCAKIRLLNVRISKFLL